MNVRIDITTIKTNHADQEPAANLPDNNDLADVHPTTENGDVQDPSIAMGLYAAGLIQRQTRRLGKLQPEVLADEDPEPLHQLRVSLRRLRTALTQFAPAVLITEAVSDRRIAKVARRTGLCRDLDVLKERLEHQLLPPLPEEERKAMKPVLKQLSRDRRQSFEGLEEALRGGPYLKLLARLHKWQLNPRFSPLGELPLRPWMFECQAHVSAGLFLHRGWFVMDPHDPELHDLRKRIKEVRYALENLEPFGGETLRDWISLLKHAQDCLGELHDLQVLVEILGDKLEHDLSVAVPVLNEAITRQQENCWRLWQDHAVRMRTDDLRHELYASLLGELRPLRQIEA